MKTTGSKKENIKFKFTNLAVRHRIKRLSEIKGISSCLQLKDREDQKTKVQYHELPNLIPNLTRSLL
jgi:hypothetical protein